MSEPVLFDSESAKQIADTVRYVETLRKNNSPTSTGNPLFPVFRKAKLIDDLYTDQVVQAQLQCFDEGTNDWVDSDESLIDIDGGNMRGFYWADDVIDIYNLLHTWYPLKDTINIHVGTISSALTDGGSVDVTLDNGKLITGYEKFGAITDDGDYVEVIAIWNYALERWEIGGSNCTWTTIEGG